MPSVQHRFIASVIPRIRKSSEVDDDDALRREKLTEQAKAVTTPPPKVVSDCEVTEVNGLGFPVYDIRPRASDPRRSDPRRSVLYLHGGGYVSHADRVHWRYVVRLSQRLDARVVFPVYPLAPVHTWRDSHPSMLRLFERIAIESPAGVTVMGDSAGGGYALSLAQQLARRCGPQPTNVVLISPWLDVTNSSIGTDEANRRDPWLKLSRLRIAGSWWAGDDDVRLPEVSPLYGDLAGLPPTLMFCGTRDTLYPQCRELADRARGTEWDLTYVEQPDLLHEYPILPIPEATRALTTTLDFLG